MSPASHIYRSELPAFRVRAVVEMWSSGGADVALLRARWVIGA
jgi:hypothetical protein